MNMNVNEEERDRAMRRGMFNRPFHPPTILCLFASIAFNSDAGIADLSDRIHPPIPFCDDLCVDLPVQHLRERPHPAEWGIAWIRSRATRGSSGHHAEGGAAAQGFPLV